MYREGTVIPGDIARWHWELWDCTGNINDDAVAVLCYLLHQPGLRVYRQRWTISAIHLHRRSVMKFVVVRYFSHLYGISLMTDSHFYWLETGLCVSKSESLPY